MTASSSNNRSTRNRKRRSPRRCISPRHRGRGRFRSTRDRGREVKRGREATHIGHAGPCYHCGASTEAIGPGSNRRSCSRGRPALGETPDRNDIWEHGFGVWTGASESCGRGRAQPPNPTTALAQRNIGKKKNVRTDPVEGLERNIIGLRGVVRRRTPAAPGTERLRQNKRDVGGHGFTRGLRGASKKGFSRALGGWHRVQQPRGARPETTPDSGGTWNQLVSGCAVTQSK